MSLIKSTVKIKTVKIKKQMASAKYLTLSEILEN